MIQADILLKGLARTLTGKVFEQVVDHNPGVIDFATCLQFRMAFTQSLSTAQDQVQMIIQLVNQSFQMTACQDAIIHNLMCFLILFQAFTENVHGLFQVFFIQDIGQSEFITT